MTTAEEIYDIRSAMLLLIQRVATLERQNGDQEARIRELEGRPQ